MENELWTMEQATAFWKVSTETVRAWIKKGLIRPQTPRGGAGEFRFLRSDVENLYQPKEPKDGKA